MVVPLILLVLSVAGMVLSVLTYGPVLSDALLICVISTFAAFVLILVSRRRQIRRYIVIDGSNVMHWQNDLPSIATLRAVLGELKKQDYVPVVWFDANVGYKIGDRYLGPQPLAKKLGIPAEQILVAPKGTPADPLLLDCAVKLQAKVVTNDRFRDWTETHPQTKVPGFLVTGNVHDDEVVLAEIA